MVKKRQPEPLPQRVLRFIKQHGLVPGYQRLLVAVSGGPDSVCLLKVLLELQNELDIELHVAHLNHQLRGAESEADAHYVSELARQSGIPVTIERQEVKAYQACHRLSLEEAAREVRYDFLARVARSIGASRIAVGHTVDDHIETILMHLIRGTGIRGLCGLRPGTAWGPAKDSLTIVRPLLEISREETADYCRHRGLVPRIDVSNLSLSPLRNRIRHQLLPLLKSYNPQVAQALLRTARIAGDNLAFLDRESTLVWDGIIQEQEGTLILDKERLSQLPPALRQNLLRMSIEKLLGNLKDIEARHIEELMVALDKPAGKQISLPGGLTFSTGYTKYLLGRDPTALSPFPALEGESPLKIPGKTPLPGWQIEATIINREQMAEEAKKLTERSPIEESLKERGINNLFTAYFDLDRSGGRLTVRPRRQGDRFQPLGLRQPKKLGEFMIDAKIPHAWRQQVPIVCSPQQILWVVGWRIDERVKVNEPTRQILRLEFKQR